MRVLTALFLFIAAPLGAQTHCDVHYRWQEKTDTTHIADTVGSTSVSQMLMWSSPAFTAAETYSCQLRNPREQTVYQLTAWARRLKVQNGATGDGDWHIELTGTKTRETEIYRFVGIRSTNGSEPLRRQRSFRHSTEVCGIRFGGAGRPRGSISRCPTLHRQAGGRM